jgi:hypothetical protein
LVAVIECIINQNARDTGAAIFPAINWPILSLCNEYNVGILEIPCPEISFWALKESDNLDNQLETHSIPVKAVAVAERSVWVS